jgi:molybdate transport system regulatory protein
MSAATKRAPGQAGKALPVKTTAAAATHHSKPVLKLRMRITIGALIAVGPGKIALLEAMAQTGSISAAAKALGMSYRRAWLLIDELNRSLQSPAVATAIGGQHGGGSKLTDTGLQLIALYRSIESQALRVAQADIKKLMQLLGD